MLITSGELYTIPPLMFASFKRQSITEDELSLTGNTLPSSSVCQVKQEIKTKKKCRIRQNNVIRMQSTQPLVELHDQKTMT